MEIINLNNNAYAPLEHTHIDDIDGTAYPEPWLKTLLDAKSNTQHTHPVSNDNTVNLTNGLAANTWINFYVANTLTRYKVFIVKIRLECGTTYPYSGCAAFFLGTTNCNATNTIYTTQMMLHNGNSITVEVRASGGNQNTPAFDFRFPSQAIPINSWVICEFLELF